MTGVNVHTLASLYSLTFIFIEENMNKLICEKKYSEIVSAPPQGLGATQTNLQRLLRSLDTVGWSSHEETGRLDRRAFTRFATGSANIFSRRQVAEAETSAVSILIDCSGSMGSGNRIETAQRVVIHLSKILQRSRVPFCVQGFRTSGEDVYNDKFHMERPKFIRFKQWGQSLQSVVAKLGAIDQCAGGGTPDYSSLVNAIEDISKREESRKILFILTDASGYIPEHMKHIQKMADALGVTLIAIGIHSLDAIDCFVNSSAVNDISELAGASFNTLIKTIQRRRTA